MTARIDMERRLLGRIRILIGVVILGLVVSGLTAFALESELRWLTRALGAEDGVAPDGQAAILAWLVRARDAIVDTNRRYPFMAYGTDWLAFAHLVLAVVFLGPLLDPRRNIWILHAGLVACVGVVLLAMIAGEIRGIPMCWRIVDCSFGVGCALPLLLAAHYTRQLESAGARQAA